MSTGYRPRRSALSSRHPAIPEPAASPEPHAEPQDTEPPAPTPSPDSDPGPTIEVTRETESLLDSAKPSARSKKMTVNIAGDLEADAKNAYWVERDEYRTFSDWVAEAISRHVEETKRRRGLDDLPVRPGGGLPTGRPLR